MQRPIVFEQPLNERTRILLRLEHLFLYCDCHMAASCEVSDRAVINGLLDILNIFTLSDLKSELIKELEVHIQLLKKMKNMPGVDSERLQIFLDSLSNFADKLHRLKGQIAGKLRNHGFINNIQQRASVPGGLSAFDVPFFHHWLQQTPEAKSKDLRGWFNEFIVVRQSVDILLHLIRSSGHTTTEMASNGLFQQSLDSTKTCRLVRISIPADAPYFAEISGGKHRVSVRFVNASQKSGERSEQVTADVEFEYCRCAMA